MTKHFNALPFFQCMYIVYVTKNNYNNKLEQMYVIYTVNLLLPRLLVNL